MGVDATLWDDSGSHEVPALGSARDWPTADAMGGSGMPRRDTGEGLKADTPEGLEGRAARALAMALDARRTAPRPTGGSALCGLADLLDALPRPPMARLVALLSAARDRGATVVLLADAASACAAEQLCRDLLREGVRVELLVGHGAPAMGTVLAERVSQRARPGDLALALTADPTADAAEDGVREALLRARDRGAATAAVARAGDAALAAARDALIIPAGSRDQLRGAQLFVAYAIGVALGAMPRARRATGGLRARPPADRAVED